MKEKKMLVDYLKVYYHYYDEATNTVREGLYCIHKILEAIEKIPVNKRLVGCRGETARLQSLIHVGDIWEMQFLRIRKEYTTGVAKDDGSYKRMPLQDDEGLGESVSAIYDKSNCALIIERNRDSVMPSDILDYFQKVASDNKILFKPIVVNKDLQRFNEKSIYRTLEIGFADLHKESLVKSKVNGLANIINGLKDFDAVNARIIITVGQNKKTQSLEKLFTKQSAEELMGNANINRLRLHARATADDNVEKIDLIENRLKDCCNFKYTREEDPADTHKRVLAIIWQSYLKNKPIVDRVGVGR